MSTKKTPVRKPARKATTKLSFAKFLKPKPIKVVTKKVLEKIAKDIFDPKTECYLNLCSGTLQNGPDPSCESRPMHCGLGELYFVVTGKQPEAAGVCEDDVIDEVGSRSTISDYKAFLDKKTAAARKQITKLDLPQDQIEDLLFTLDEYQHEDTEEALRKCLGKIPDENDQGDEGNNAKEFKARASRVAACLREAASLLPR
jgi:hypothetical protein